MQSTRRSVVNGITTLLALAGLPRMTVLAATPQRIGVIGAGSLGGTVGRVWVKAGHEVLFSTRHPEELASMVRDLGPRARAGTAQEAARFGSVILFSVPYPALAALGQELQADLRGKIVLDACNASASASDALSRDARANGVGVTSAKALPGTRLVRAFSAVDATAVEASFTRRTGKLGVPLAADDKEALQLASQLVRDAGCEPVIVGNLLQGKSFERDGPGFRANTDAARLRKLLGL
jgi:predicted dinucleotide-binding enzyme